MPELERLNPRLIKFIEAQKMFFVATAASNGLVNTSPKGMDTLKVLSENRIVVTRLPQPRSALQFTCLVLLLIIAPASIPDWRSFDAVRTG